VRAALVVARGLYLYRDLVEFRRGDGALPPLTGLEGEPTLAEKVADYLAGARIDVAMPQPPRFPRPDELQAALGASLALGVLGTPWQSLAWLAALWPLFGAGESDTPEPGAGIKEAQLGAAAYRVVEYDVPAWQINVRNGSTSSGAGRWTLAAVCTRISVEGPGLPTYGPYVGVNVNMRVTLWNGDTPTAVRSHGSIGNDSDPNAFAVGAPAPRSAGFTVQEGSTTGPVGFPSGSGGPSLVSYSPARITAPLAVALPQLPGQPIPEPAQQIGPATLQPPISAPASVPVGSGLVPQVRPALPPAVPSPGTVPAPVVPVLPGVAPVPVLPDATVPQPQPVPVLPTPGGSVTVGTAANPIAIVPKAVPATLEGIAQETGRIERKLEVLLGDPTSGQPDWLEKITAGGDFARLLWEVLTSLTAGTVYTLDSPCEVDANGEKLPAVEVEAPGALNAIEVLINRVDALAELLQVHKDLKQPGCKNPRPQGDAVTVNFEQI
jgi:hypothetical protein